MSAAGVGLKRVLVVEDDEDSADLMAETLARLGCQVALAYSGAEALEQVVAFLPEVALVDLGLPDMDGAELGPKLRSCCAQSLRLIALTGYSDERVRARLRALGFERHLVKPVHPDTVADALRQAPSSACLTPQR